MARDMAVQCKNGVTITFNTSATATKLMLIQFQLVQTVQTDTQSIAIVHCVTLKSGGYTYDSTGVRLRFGRATSLRPFDDLHYDRLFLSYNTIQYNIRLIKADRTQPVHNVKR